MTYRAAWPPRRLAASQRNFLRNGAVFSFTTNGKSYFMNNATGNTEPANIAFSSNGIFSSTQTDSNGLYIQLPSGNLGNTFFSATGKLAFHYTPNRYLAFRGSVGTGLRAPGLSDIVGAVVFASSTSGTYVCPFPG